MVIDSRQSKKIALATGVWLLWIDSVGGFRLLEGDRFTIGGPGEDQADIAVRSAWRRQMATLSRIGDDFWLQHATALDPAAAATPVLIDEQLPIVSGAANGNANEPKLRLRKPSPLSGTVVITLDPPHRFVLPVDGMLIADRTILIGHERTSHIYAPRLSGSGLVMMKRADQWWIRRADGTPQPLVDGERTEIDELVMTIRCEPPTRSGVK